MCWLILLQYASLLLFLINAIQLRIQFLISANAFFKAF
jgi:hypothetical protein